jgi:aminoglycoside phosphotransferase family enzyme
MVSMGQAAARQLAPDAIANGDRIVCGLPAVPLAAKVAFLKRPDAYGPDAHGQDRGPISCRETHMSWLFLTQDEVYKLKKPVRFPYLDFSSLERRRTACNAELALNKRLAPDVYRRVAPLTRRGDRLAIGGAGEVVDWLVVMRRLDEEHTLERLLLARRLTPQQLNPLIAVLARLYRRAPKVVFSPAGYVARWRRGLAANRRILLDRRFGLPAVPVRRIDRWQREFLQQRAELLLGRLRHRLIVDGHGDLRPEHIWPEPPVRIIDCLEFNADLRAVDPLDELAFLYVECSRLGAARHGAHLVRRLAETLPGGFSPNLFTFYCSYRAMVRARLAIAHLLEPRPSSPEKWRPLALDYLRAADRARQCLALSEGVHGA